MGRFLAPPEDAEFTPEFSGLPEEVLPATPLASGEAAAAIGQDPRAIAAAAAAVAMASEELELEERLVEVPVEDRPVGGWKSYGRWEIMSARLGVLARRTGRRDR
jgi:hypothetical protein